MPYRVGYFVALLCKGIALQGCASI